MRVSYYAIREELEADAGISEQVATYLVIPDVTDTLTILVHCEDSDKYEHYSAF
jgi:hypothetical protein